MSRLRGHWPEAPNLTFDRWLTARPAVLAKTFGTGPSYFPSDGSRPGPHVPRSRAHRLSLPAWYLDCRLRLPRHCRGLRSAYDRRESDVPSQGSARRTEPDAVSSGCRRCLHEVNELP